MDILYISFPPLADLSVLYASTDIFGLSVFDLVPMSMYYFLVEFRQRKNSILILIQKAVERIALSRISSESPPASHMANPARPLARMNSPFAAKERALSNDTMI